MFCDYIKAFCEASSVYEFYPNYSGRWMFGRVCCGITVPEGFFYMEMLIRLTEYFDGVGADDVNLELDGVSVDQLGKGVIVYFPNVAVDAGGE